MEVALRAAAMIAALGASLLSESGAASVKLDPQPSFALSACWMPGGMLVIPEIQQGLLYVVDPAVVGRLSRRPFGVDLRHDHYRGNPRWPHTSAYQSFSLRTLASVDESLFYLYYDETPVLLNVSSGLE